MSKHRAGKPVPLEILHNDDDIVAINKPAGLAAIPGRAEATSVLTQLAAQLGLPDKGTADPRLRVVHRLDKDTSGVMIFAKHVGAQRHLSHQFQNNTIQKEYVALVSGKSPESSGSIVARLAPHPTAKDRMAVSKHGRPAQTDWKVEAEFRLFTLIRAFPKTGKTHQIRVHLAHIGMPLAIDPLYHPTADGTGGAIFLSDFKRDYRPNRGEDERPLMSRLTLHAQKLSFNHPNGQPMSLNAELPKDFRATMNQLSRHG